MWTIIWNILLCLWNSNTARLLRLTNIWHDHIQNYKRYATIFISFLQVKLRYPSAYTLIIHLLSYLCSNIGVNKIRIIFQTMHIKYIGPSLHNLPAVVMKQIYIHFQLTRLHLFSFVHPKYRRAVSLHLKTFGGHFITGNSVGRVKTKPETEL